MGLYFKVRSAKTFPKATWSAREGKAVVSCIATKERLFWSVTFAQLLSKCPSHTKLCQEHSGTVNLRIPSVMLFQTACSVRASLA